MIKEFLSTRGPAFGVLFLGLALFPSPGRAQAGDRHRGQHVQQPAPVQVPQAAPNPAAPGSDPGFIVNLNPGIDPGMIRSMDPNIDAGIFGGPRTEALAFQRYWTPTPFGPAPRRFGVGPGPRFIPRAAPVPTRPFVMPPPLLFRPR